MTGNIRYGLAYLCAAALCGLIWLALRTGPSDGPVGTLAGLFVLLTLLLAVVGLGMLVVGLLKPPP